MIKFILNQRVKRFNNYYFDIEAKKQIAKL